MKDTSKKIEKIYTDLLLKKTPEERLKMGCSMFDLACAIIKSSFPRSLSNLEKRQNLFLRLYELDFNEDIKNKLLMKM